MLFRRSDLGNTRICSSLSITEYLIPIVYTKSNSIINVLCAGKMQKPLPELLKEYDMAAGIFPRDATNYEFNEETGKLTVFIPAVCEVGYKDSSVLRFSTSVTGYLEKGKLVEQK
jgi:hypothetical protein